MTKTLKHILLALLFGAFLAGTLPAQEPAADVPALIAKDPDGKPLPMILEKYVVETKIQAFAAETSVTMTFRNETDRILAGNLYFPLPEGTTIDGYALDINGAMIDGVAVTKERARVVYENVVRQGIDPGLVEWSGGNSFKTRVFPIPSKGTRTIRVRYVCMLEKHAETGEIQWRLPLKFAQAVENFQLRLEVIRPDAAPRVVDGALQKMKFKPWRKSFVAETQEKNFLPGADLIITLPKGKKAAKNAQKVLVSPEGDKMVFAVRAECEKPLPKKDAKDEKSGHVTIFWDASGSRSGIPHEKEYEFLTAFLTASDLSAEVVVVRNVAKKPVFFDKNENRVENASKIIEFLKTVPYDGGTSLGAVKLPEGETVATLALLFTDGISNFAQLKPEKLGVPLHVFATGTQIDTPRLNEMAILNGGTYFNLDKVTPEQAAQQLGAKTLRLTKVEGTNIIIDDTYPKLTPAVTGPIMVAGRMSAPTAELVLTFSLGDEVFSVQKYALKAEAEMAAGTGASRSEAERPDRSGNDSSLRSDRKEVENDSAVLSGRSAPLRVAPVPATMGSDLAARLFAQTKLAELVIFPEENRDAIESLGKEFGLVTPETSLLVLDSIDQYVQYEICPPATLPEMRDEYLRRMDTVEKQRTAEHESKINQVLNMWNARVAWWNTEFKYPKDFRVPSSGGKSAGSLNGGGVRLDTTSAAPVTESADFGDDDDDFAPPAPVLSGRAPGGRAGQTGRMGESRGSNVEGMATGAFDEDEEDDDLCFVGSGGLGGMGGGFDDEDADEAEALPGLQGVTIRADAENAAPADEPAFPAMEAPADRQIVADSFAPSAEAPAEEAMFVMDLPESSEDRSSVSVRAGVVVNGRASLDADGPGRTAPGNAPRSPIAPSASLDPMSVEESRSVEVRRPASGGKSQPQGDGQSLSDTNRWEDAEPGEQFSRGERDSGRDASQWREFPSRDSSPGRPLGENGRVMSRESSVRETETSLPQAIAASPARDRDRLEAEGEELSLRDSSQSSEVSEEQELDMSGRPGVASFGATTMRAPAKATVTPQKPEPPYLKEMREAGPEKAYEVYLAQRKTFGTHPAFFLECSLFFESIGQHDLAVRVLSNLAELELENVPMLRILGRRLMQMNEPELAVLVFERVKPMRGEEPHSYRDLALALIRATEGKDAAEPEGKARLQRALELLNDVVMKHWDGRFSEIEVFALEEANTLVVPRLQAAGVTEFPLDARLIQQMDLDLRIVMEWDADATDIDLWVTEPSGEKVYYSHNRSVIGGFISRDFTQGYGPEEYLLRNAMPGKYAIQAHFFGSRSVELFGSVTVQAEVYTNWGRPNQTRECLTFQLDGAREVFTIGEIEK